MRHRPSTFRLEEVTPYALNVLLHMRDVLNEEDWASSMTPPPRSPARKPRTTAGESWVRWWERLALAHAVAYSSAAEHRPLSIQWLGETVNHELAAPQFPTLEGSPALQRIARASIAEAMRRAAAAPRRTEGSVVERVGREMAAGRTTSGSLDRTFLVVDVPGTWSRTLGPQVTLVGAQACADEETVRVLLLCA